MASAAKVTKWLAAPRRKAALPAAVAATSVANITMSRRHREISASALHKWKPRVFTTGAFFSGWLEKKLLTALRLRSGQAPNAKGAQRTQRKAHRFGGTWFPLRSLRQVFAYFAVELFPAFKPKLSR